MQKRITAFFTVIILLIGLFSTSTYAITPGISEYDIDLTVFSNTESIELNKSGEKTAKVYIPFNSAGGRIEYRADTDGKLTIDLGDSKADIAISSDSGSVEFELPNISRLGNKTVLLTSDTAITITKITMFKEDVTTTSDYELLDTVLTDMEQLEQNAVIICEDAVAIKAGGAMRYIDEDNARQTPLYIDGSIYLPAAAFADAFGYYLEDEPNKQYMLIRDDEHELVLKNGTLTLKKGESERKPLNNNVSYVNGKTYIPLRFTAELFGKCVYYRNGIVVADEEYFADKLINNDDNFESLEKEMSYFKKQDACGVEYHVSPNGSDENTGSSDSPFATLQKAANIAKEGDTVIIHEGTYREILKPKNNGTPSNPIVFKAADGEKVTISACETVSGFVKYENDIYVAPMAWDLGKGMNVMIKNGEGIPEARHPNADTSPRHSFRDLGISPYFLTQGNIRVQKSNGALTAKSTTDLNQTKDFWKGGILVSRHGFAWSMGSAEIVGSDRGELTLGNPSKGWWFGNGSAASWFGSAEEYENDCSYITATKNAIDVPGEWSVEDNVLYYMPQKDEDINTLSVEMKKRQLTADLENSKYVILQGVETVGGSIKMNNSEMCVLKDNSMKYINHYTYFVSGNGDDFDTVGQSANGAMKRGEMGIYIGGINNEVVNCTIDTAAAAGVILVGKYTFFKNNIVRDCGYMGSYISGVRLQCDKTIDKRKTTMGGHTLIYNSICNTGRALISAGGGDHTTGIPPYLACEIAYNDIYNGNLETLDTGNLYTYGITMGNDRKYTRIHHNLVRNSWAYDFHNGVNVGLYYDNYTEMVKSYDNLILSSSEYNRVTPTFINNGSHAYDWNNLYMTDYEKDDLKAEDYPGMKPFRAGALNDSNSDFMMNYENIEQGIEQYPAKNAELSQGVILEEGMAKFSADGQYITFKDVDLGSDKNRKFINFYFSSDLYNKGDKFELRVGKTFESSVECIVLDPITEAYELSGINYQECCVENIGGLQNIYIVAKDFKAALFRYMTIEEIPANENLAGIIYGENVSAIKTGQLMPEYSQSSIDPFHKRFNNTWGGTVFMAKDITIGAETSNLIFTGATGNQWSGNEMEIRLNSLDSEPITTIKIVGTNWSFEKYSAKLDTPIEPGVYTFYFSFKGKDYSSVFDRLEFMKVQEGE